MGNDPVTILPLDDENNENQIANGNKTTNITIPPNNDVQFDMPCNEDHTTGSFYLCCLLCALSKIITSGAICKNVHLYTIIISRDGMAVYMCSSMLFLTCAVTVVCISMLILQTYG